MSPELKTVVVPGAVPAPQRKHQGEAVSQPTRTELRAALYLPLAAQAASQEAEALAQGLSHLINEHDRTDLGRVRRRRDKGLQKLLRAVEAFVGDLLLNAAPMARGWSYLPTDAKNFSGNQVPYRQFQAVYRAAQALGWVEVVREWQQFLLSPGSGFGSPSRNFAPRMRPTPLLMEIAEKHGVSIRAIDDHFTRPERWEHKDLLILKSPSIREGHLKAEGKPMRFPETAETIRLRSEIQEVNDFIANTRVQGCPPVVLRRIFNGSFEQGGRWYGIGADNYQQRSKEERLSITINDEAVVEMDVKASHLTILYGLQGQHLDPQHDPYSIEDLPRAVVKAWITATLGNGRPIKQWSRSAKEEALKAGVNLLQYPAKRVKEALLQQHPLLSEVETLEVDSLKLMYLEAQAITHAMLTLKREHGVLALPVHDSLIVPASASGVSLRAIEEGYGKVVGVEPTVETSEGKWEQHPPPSPKHPKEPREYTYNVSG